MHLTTVVGMGDISYQFTTPLPLTMSSIEVQVQYPTYVAYLRWQIPI